MLLSIPKLISYSVSHHAEQNSNQFSLIKVDSTFEQLLVDAPQLKFSEAAYGQFEVLGLFIDNHPLKEYEELLEELKVQNTQDLLSSLPDGSGQIKIAGIIQKKDARMSARGRFITLQLSDPYGIFDISIVSEDVLKNYVHLLDVKTAVIATCEYFKDEGGTRITARSFSSIEDMVKDNIFSLRLRPKSDGDLEQIINILHRCTNKDNNVNITLLLPAEEKFVAKIDLAESFYVENEDLLALKEFNQS